MKVNVDQELEEKSMVYVRSSPEWKTTSYRAADADRRQSAQSENRSLGAGCNFSIEHLMR